MQTSTYDLQDEAVVRRWAAEAAQKKPWRPELWDLFADLLLKEATSPLRILELGAGPGLLAARILREVPVSEYVLFDFSERTIAMAKDTLGEREDVSFPARFNAKGTGARHALGWVRASGVSPF